MIKNKNEEFFSQAVFLYPPLLNWVDGFYKGVELCSSQSLFFSLFVRESIALSVLEHSARAA